MPRELKLESHQKSADSIKVWLNKISEIGLLLTLRSCNLEISKRRSDSVCVSVSETVFLNLTRKRTVQDSLRILIQQTIRSATTIFKETRERSESVIIVSGITKQNTRQSYSYQILGERKQWAQGDLGIFLDQLSFKVILTARRAS
ncbi:hypothetical protein J6590_050424 [Homalodisca vitripennis]|nr:hypothetical protein J6590_050424 [Homalodisca vitripennis]